MRLEHEFDADSVRALAFEKLHRNVPPAGVDPLLEAPFGDDDLNPHVPKQMNGAPRMAAVLVPIVQRSPEVTVLLTRRTDELPTHAGQVAFPGGKIDDSDDGAVAAALRETHEETGIDPQFVDVIGFLDAYQTRTGFRVVPVVAMLNDGFDLVPEPGEVAEIFEVPLGFLMNPDNHLLETRTWQGIDRVFYKMPYDRHFIWGATAGMLRSLYHRMYRDG